MGIAQVTEKKGRCPAGDEFQNGNCTDTRRLLSYASAPLGTSEWQTKGLRDTENEGMGK